MVDTVVEELGGYLTVPGAARRAGLPESAIRRAASEGRLTAVRKWHRVLFRAEDVDRFVQQHVRAA